MKKNIITREYAEKWPSESQQGISGLTDNTVKSVISFQILTLVISGLLLAGFFSPISEIFWGNILLLVSFPLLYIVNFHMSHAVFEGSWLNQPLWAKDFENNMSLVSLSNLRKTEKC